MKKPRFTEEQIVFVLKQAELGTSVPDVCRKLGITDATFYILRKKYGGIYPSELKHMHQLEEENVCCCQLMCQLECKKHNGRRSVQWDKSIVIIWTIQTKAFSQKDASNLITII